MENHNNKSKKELIKEIEKLKEKQIFNSSLLKMSPDLIYVYDIVQRKNIYSNTGITKILDYSVEEIKNLGNQILPDLMHPDDFQNYLNVIVPRYRKASDSEYIEHEYRMKHKNGTWRILHSKENIFKRLKNGEPEHILGITKDITERKQAEEALGISEEKFRKAFMTSPDSININRLEDGMYVSINNGFTNIMGYSEEEIIGKTSLELNNWKNSNDRKKLVEELKTKGFVKNLEAEFQSKKGDIIYGLMSASLIELDGVLHTMNITRDITERKQFEFEIKESKDRFQALSEASYEAIFLSEKGICFEQNFAAEKMFGYTLAEAIGRSGTDWISPEDRKQVMYNMLSGNEEPYRITALRKDGSMFPAEIQGKMMHYKGKPIRVTALRDITERKLAEDALIEKEKELRIITDSTLDTVFMLNKKGTIVYLNQAAVNLYGLKLEEMLNTSFTKFVPLRELPKYFTQLKNVFLNKRVTNFETIIIDGTGKEIPVEINGQLIKKNGKTFALGTIRDITERKQASEKLHLYKKIIEESKDAIAIIDKQGFYLEQNKAHKSLIGFSDEELKGKTPAIHFGDEVYSKIVNELSKKNNFRGELISHTKTGDLDIDLSAFSVTDDTGEIICRVGIKRDISERKQLERILQEKENRMQSIFRAAPIGIGVVQNRIFITVNKHLCDICGYSADELINQSSKIIYPSKQEFEFAGQEKYKQIKQFGTGTVETQFKHKNGRLIDILLSSTPINQNNLNEGITFTALDITRRKQNAEKLKTQNTELVKAKKQAEKREERIKIQFKNIDFLRQAASHFANDTYDSDIYGFIGKKLKELIPNAYILISEIHNLEIIPKSIIGIGSVYSKIISILGHNPIEKKYLYDENLIDLSGGYIKKFKGNLRKLFLNSLSKTVSASVEKLLKIEHIYGIGFIVDQKIYANAAIVLPKEADIQNIETIETFIKQASLALKRKKEELELAENIKIAEKSESKFRSIFEESTDGIMLINADNIPLDVNKKICEILDYKKEELLTMNPSTLIHPDDLKSKEHEKAMKALMDGETIKVNYRFRKKDQSYIYAELSTKLIGKNNFLNILRDVSELRNHQDALKASEYRNRILFDYAPIPIWDEDFSMVKKAFDELKLAGVKDFRTYFEHNPFEVNRLAGLVKIIAVNEKSNEFYGVDSLTQLTTKLTDWFDEDSFITFKNELIALAEGKTKYEADIKIKDLNGETKYLHLSLNIPPTSIHTLERVIVSFLDITERKLAEEELNKHHTNLEKLVKKRTKEVDEKAVKIEASQQAMRFLMEDMNDAREALIQSNKKIKEANKDIESFAYSVSHDLKSPLRAINGYTKVLLEDFPDIFIDEKKEFMDLIIQNSSKMNTLIDDLLRFSRAGRDELDISEFDLSVMVKDVFNSLTEGNSNKNKQISIQENISINADIAAIKQVLINLIGNALKFSAKNELIQIEFGLKDYNDQTCYFIKDNGIGFDTKYTDKLFEVFQRLHSSDKFEGTGVGLALVKRIISKHGGDITAESEIGKGSTFYFTVS